MGHDNQPDHTSTLLLPGTTVAHYVVVRHLGNGGMGEVYLAQDRSLDRLVALKLLLNSLNREPEARSRFLREARTLASLDHPNIIKVFEVSEHGDRPFMAMQYVDGLTLGAFARAHRLDPSRLLTLMISICCGLEAAHANRVIHRDLKPGNIMVDRSQRVFLLDFGLAEINQLESTDSTEKTITHLTQAGYPIGTVAYMAPEQLRGLPVDQRADIFSLGVTLCELASGEHPFVGATPAEIASSILRDEPRMVLSGTVDLPPDLGKAILRCLRKDAARRYQTVSDLRIELEDLLDSLKSGHQEVPAPLLSSRESSPLTERHFVLSAELVRELEYRSPQMIGDRMTYLDNGTLSDTLAVVLHGMGLDQRSVANVISHLPCRAIAPTLYGFGADSPHRLPLSLSDQSILLRAMFRQVIPQAQAEKVVLVGVSSGSDHLLHMLSDDPEWGKEITGLLLLGVNVNMHTCQNSRIFSELKGDTGTELLASLQAASKGLQSLGDWLLVSSYQVQVLEKFKTDLAPLSRYASDIVAPFAARGHQQFIDWYRLAVEHLPYVRFVFLKEEWEPLDTVLQLHLEQEVLGRMFTEETIVRKDTPHMQLLHAPTVVQCIEEFLAGMTRD